MRDSSLCHLFTLVCNLHTILIIIFTTTDAAPVYLDSKCSNKTCFGPNSTYQTNLNVVFQSLSSNAAITTTGFHFTATGNGTDNAVYGLFLCRGDQNTTSCRDCVSVAAEDLPRSYCPGKKQAIIWYNECMVRYSNENVLGKMEESPKLLIWNSLNVSRSQTTFADILNNEMKILVVEASSDQSGKKFAAKVVNLTRSQILFATVQCTPDLTEADCTRCLKTAVSQLSIGVSGKILQPSCNAFYQVGLPHFVDSITARKQIGKKQSISKVIIVVIGPITAVLAAMMAFNLLNKRSKNCNVQVIDSHQLQGGMQSLQYDLETLDQATNNFSSVNVIGVGRHGCVYKGTLPNGLEVAVKKLRQSYGQHLSLQLLEDEMLSLAKLQHRNLVKFHGFCLDGVEKLLVYEYVPNKSLDNYLYDHLPHKRLGWESRYQIICGIARGIHYLHQDSQLRIIHGDLKLESVLLDAHMNPKLSDFSLTKIISNGQIENEYSIRSDIYKFGVLLFEVISGKNDYFLSRMYDYGLLEYAWKQWIGGTPLEFVDSKIRDAYSSDQVIRCMHIGFLCIQPDTDDNEKPTMASIVLMLDNSTITLPPPAEPAFFFSSEVEPINKAEPSVNKISITDLDPR